MDLALRILQGVAIVVVMAAAAVWLAHDVDLDQVTRTLGSARPTPLLGVFGLLLVNHLARSLRIGALVDAPVAAWDLVRISAVAFFAIQLLPLRLGELVRPQLLVRHGVPFGEGLAATAVDRTLDIVALLTAIALVAWFAPLPDGALEVGGVDVVDAAERASLVVVALTMGGLLGLAIFGPSIQKVVASLPLVGTLAAQLVGRITESLRRLAESPHSAVAATAWTGLSWTTTIALVWLAMQAFDGLPGSWTTSLVLWTAIVCAIVVLPTPGSFGPFEAAGVATLAVFGTAPDTAKAFVVVLHTSIFTFGLAIAAISMVTLRLNPRDLFANDQSAPR